MSRKGFALRWLLLASIICSVAPRVLHARPVESGRTFLKSRIIHVPVTSVRQGQPFEVEARVDASGRGINFMRLYFKLEDDQDFKYLEMSQSGDTFRGEIPADRYYGSKLYYFILGFQTDQEVVTYPDWNPYGNPIEVTILAGVPGPGQKAPENSPSDLFQDVSPTRSEDLGEDSPVLFLSPEPNEQFGGADEVLIAVSFIPPDGGDIDVKSVNLFLDDLDVSDRADISENLVTYSATRLSPGRHRVVAQANTAGGVKLPSGSLIFVVKGQQRRSNSNNSFQGRVFAETRHESFSNIGFHDNNVGGFLSGNTGILKYDSRLYLTTREDSNFQPRHRFSFNFDLPILGVTLGDTYPRFNNLMLWGKRVRGVYGRLHFGFINFDVVAGQTFRGIRPKFRSNLVLADSLQSSGTFEQNLLGLRTSFGNGKHFQFGLNVLKVRDDTTSITRKAFKAASILPRDNFVVGSDFLLSLNRRRFEIRGAIAASLLTKDISDGVLSKQDIEDQFDVDLPFDPADFSDYLILNASTTPLDPRDLTSLAFDVSLRLNYFNNNFLLGYKSLGSQYTSLGTTFLRTNLRGLYFNDRVRLLKNKIYFNFGIEAYDDNFDADNQNSPTDLTTVSSGFSIYPSPRLPSINFSLRSHNRDNNITTIDPAFIDNSNPAAPDTLSDPRENNDTRDLNVQLNYDTQFFDVRNTWSISYIKSDRNDQFVSSTENSSNVQVFSLRSQYQIPLITTINFARNDNKFGNGINNFNFKMFGAKAEYQLLRRKLRTYAGINITSADGKTSIGAIPTATTDYTRTAFNTGAQLDLSGHRFSLDASIIDFSDKGTTFDPTTATLIPNPSFTDTIVRLFYETRF